MASIDVSQINRLAVDLGKASAKGVALAQKVVVATAYKIEGTGKEFAVVDTGAMRNSIGVDLGVLSAVIGPTVSYAPFVELGTARMAPRAFMGPALDRHTPDFVAAMEKAAGQAFD